jgi:hypothetical protein
MTDLKSLIRPPAPPALPAPQFILVPLTGVQVCRRLPLRHLSGEAAQAFAWDAARAEAARWENRDPLTGLVRDHIACDQQVESSGWVPCAPGEAAFFRLIRLGHELAADLVIDTQNGGGRTPGNRIDCLVGRGVGPLRHRMHVASFVVVGNDQPRNMPGTLVMDFGNTATSCIFSPAGTAALDARPVLFHSPFDPFEGDESRRPRRDRSMLQSTTLLLYVPPSDVEDPWVVLGRRAEELIATQDPLTTSLYAPKKYVRHWEAELKPQEPTTPCRGLLGQWPGLYPKLQFVGLAVGHVMQQVLSSIVNPDLASPSPEAYPMITGILLTYPLTWREADRELFRDLVRAEADRLLVLPPREAERFRVDLVCSEPVAVAAYALWETFLHFYYLGRAGRNLTAPSLASSLFGNPEGSQELRLLVVDVGGGSTDIALVHATWDLPGGGDAGVDVRFRVLESLRFNRAGDRLSHLLATALLEFVRDKYGVSEPLDFEAHSSNPAFTRSYKRQAVSKITELAERAKAALSAGEGPWVLDAADEAELVRAFEPLGPKAAGAGRRLEVSHDTLRQWAEADQASMRTRGQPGFMDIFFHLEELREGLAARRQLPHLVVLSGRTTRLPFVRELTARSVGLPPHRVRSVGELLPESVRGPGHEDMDKLAVVHGAHRVRFGEPIRFHPLEDDNAFRRYVGLVRETPAGFRLSRVLAAPGESRPRTVGVTVGPRGTVLVGHSFREEGRAEVTAVLTNTTGEAREVEVDLLNDQDVVLRRSPATEGVFLTERVPGGSDLIVDNFSDTGMIDREPEGLLRDIISRNRPDWDRGGPW